MCERCSQTGMLSGELAHSNKVNKVICFSSQFWPQNCAPKGLWARGPCDYEKRKKMLQLIITILATKLCPEGVMSTGTVRLRKKKKDATINHHNFGHKNHPLKMTYFAVKVAKIVRTYTRVRALNVSLSHPEGVWYHPFGVVTKKKISCPFAMPYSDGAVSPIRSGPKVPKKKKKSDVMGWRVT